jgi:hypothetical protein
MGLVSGHDVPAFLATSESIVALSAQRCFPGGTGIVLAAPSWETSSVTESAAVARKQMADVGFSEAGSGTALSAVAVGFQR